MASIFLKRAERVKRSRAGWAALPAVAAAIAYFALAADVLAHARLKRANPPVGGVVSATTVPAELQGWFSGPVEPSLRDGEVPSSERRRMERGSLRREASDLAQ